MASERSIDMLNNMLKEIVFRSKNSERFKRLANRTHFNYREVEALATIHRKCVETLGPMNRMKFRDIFQSGFDFTENIRHLLIDKVFSAFDKPNASQILLDQWVEGLSVMLRGTLDEKIQFAYQVYESAHILKKEYIFLIMNGCLIKLPTGDNPDDAVKDLIDLLIKKLDVDRDGYISEEDFRITVKEKDPLLLECMGPVFPSREACNVFLNTFTDQLGRY
ncbi:calaxin [Ptiloglossa arizonensis]|uniref:calaxin n=1 Tax=Ptiloglossa arizonensis TaxID=3350558 RepID=UPI003F9F5946